MKQKSNFFKKIISLAVLSFFTHGSVSLALAANPTVQVDGSSTVFPITEGIAEEFQNAESGATRVTVGISGTGGGFKKFCRGETDVSNASRPILASEIEVCKAAGIEYYELPIAFDALTVVVNPKNNWASQITIAELKKLWEPEAQGKITQWNQIRSDWPAQEIKLYGAGSDSGTFDYFTEATVGKAKSSRGDYTASEDDNVLVQGVSGDLYALGYFGYAYYIENEAKLKAVGIDAGKGAVLPSPKTVEDGTYAPLSRPIFIYVSKKSAQKPEVKKFVEFYLKNAASIVKEVKYIPLPADVYTALLDRFQKGKVGTAFSGKEAIGSTLQDIVKIEPKP